MSACTCERSEPAAGERLAAASVQPPPTRPAASLQRLEAEDAESIANVPVEEDFQQQMLREIQVDDLEAELDQIERELSGTP